MSIHAKHVLLYAGGECLQKFGTLFMGTNGRQRIAPTHTRSGAVGPFVGSGGKLGQASTNRPRIFWEDDDEDGYFETPTLLLETPAFTNLVTSDNFETGWSNDGTPVSTEFISDPAGGTTAFRIADDTISAAEGKYRAVTFTGNAVKALVFVVREATMPASGAQELSLWDNSAGTYRLNFGVSAWVAGKPTVSVSTGTLLGTWALGNGYWAIAGQSTSVTAANTNRVYIYPATVNAQQGSIDMYRVNAYNATSPPRSILNASASKATEALSFPWLHSPIVSMSGHMRFRELEAPTWSATSYIMHLGAGSSPRLILLRSSGATSYIVQHTTTTGSVTATVDINSSWGDLVDLFWWYYVDGSVKIAARKKSPGGSWGAITTSAQSSALTPASAWSDDVIHFGSVSGSAPGSQAYHRALIARGSAHSTDDLLEMFA